MEGRNRVRPVATGNRFNVLQHMLLRSDYQDHRRLSEQFLSHRRLSESSIELPEGGVKKYLGIEMVCGVRETSKT